METIINRTNKTINKISTEIKDDVIKNKIIKTLTDINTLKETGIAVELTLSTKYTYTADQLEQWSEQLKAYCCMISVKRNQLIVKFYIHN